MTSYGDQKRADAARNDLTKLAGGGAQVGLVLLDEDHREAPVLEGEVVRVGPDFVLFRHEGLDEEIPLAIIAKRVLGDQVVMYGTGPRR